MRKISNNTLNVLISAVILIILIFAAFIAHKWNLYAYFFYNESYSGHHFITKKFVVAPNTPQYNALLTSDRFVSHSYTFPHFSSKITLDVPITLTGIDRYQQFLNGYFAILAANKNDEDTLARLLRQYVYNTYNKNGNLPDTFSNLISKLKESSPVENMIYIFANTYSGCGINSITLEALLRYAHIKSRMLYIAFVPNKIEANHVTIEYYSKKYAKWILLDPTLNISPYINNHYLSAFELQTFLSHNQHRLSTITPDIATAINSTYFDPKNIIVYDNVGPITHSYYFSASKETRRKIIDYVF